MPATEAETEDAGITPATPDPALAPVLAPVINSAPVVVLVGLDLRDNQLDELSQGSSSTSGAVVNLNGVDPDSMLPWTPSSMLSFRIQYTQADSHVGPLPTLVWYCRGLLFRCCKLRETSCPFPA